MTEKIARPLLPIFDEPSNNLADLEGAARETLRDNQQLNIYSLLGRSERLGVWGFGYKERGSYSLVGGLYYGFTDDFELSLGAGIEKYEMEMERGDRFAGSLLLWSEKTCSLTLYYERGRTTEDHWYQGDLFCEPVDGFGVGIFSQRFAGTGPRLLIGITDKLPLEVWVAPFMYDFESKRSGQMLGVRLVFGER